MLFDQHPATLWHTYLIVLSSIMGHCVRSLFCCNYKQMPLQQPCWVTRHVWYIHTQIHIYMHIYMHTHKHFVWYWEYIQLELVFLVLYIMVLNGFKFKFKSFFCLSYRKKFHESHNTFIMPATYWTIAIFKYGFNIQHACTYSRVPP